VSSHPTNTATITLELPCEFGFHLDALLSLPIFRRLAREIGDTSSYNPPPWLSHTLSKRTKLEKMSTGATAEGVPTAKQITQEKKAINAQAVVPRQFSGVLKGAHMPFESSATPLTHF
jgi:hypothetical protein